MENSRTSNPAAVRKSPDDHQANIQDQFGRQAALFAGAKSLHRDDVIAVLVDAAKPLATDEVLDVACGPGTVAVAFADKIRRVVGVDLTVDMLAEARRLSKERSLENVEWVPGDANALPFPDASFDIVTCRFAFHHMERPAAVLAEMKRVCRQGGRVVLCDGVASNDTAKAEAFNAMERFRDSSTTRFMSLEELSGLFEKVGLAKPEAHPFQVRSERDMLARISFPVDDDRDGLKAMIDASVDGDTMGLGAHHHEDTVRFHYPSVVLVSKRV